MNDRLRICSFLLAACLFCLIFSSAHAEVDLMVNGKKYSALKNQTLYGGLCAQGTAEGGGIELIAVNADDLPCLYTAPGSASVCGIYARGGSSELFLTPSSEHAPIAFDFITLDGGAQMKLRLWSSTGEAAILNGGNPAFVVTQTPADNGEILTCLTRTALSGNTLSGETTIYRSSDGVLRFSGSAQRFSVSAPAGAATAATLKWTFDVSSHKLTAAAANANGSSDGISYYAYVNDALLMSGRNTKKASGTVKTKSSRDQWRLRVVFPELGEFCSPIFTMKGGIATLSDGRQFLTHPEAAPTPTPTPSAAPQPAVTLAPTAALTPAPSPTPRPTALFSGPALPIPEADAPYELDADSSLFFASSADPQLQITVDELRFHVELLSLPDGAKLDHIGMVQRRTDGAKGTNLQNGFTADSWFTAGNTDSTVTLTLYLQTKDGKTSAMGCGSFIIKAS